MPYRQRFSPIPSKTSAHRPTTGEGAASRAPGGEWLPKSLVLLVSGGRQSHQPCQGGGGDNKGQEGTAGGWS